MEDKKRDAFFTKREVALECSKILSEVIPYFGSAVFLEPSAGDGSFVDGLKSLKVTQKKILSYDIFPKQKGIREANFLKNKINGEIKSFGDNKNLIIVGNPPFGKRSKLAIEFLNKSSLFADVVAFVVPNQFTKWSVQSKLNPSLKLIFDKKLEEESFVFKGKPYKVRCHFQIWSKYNFGFKDLRLKFRPEIDHPDFDMFQYNNTKQARKYFNKSRYNWNFAVVRQGYYDYSKRVYKEEDLDPKIQWIFFRAEDERVLERLKNIDFEKLAKNNTSVLGFGKHDVVKHYKEKYGNDNLSKSIKYEQNSFQFV